MNKLLPLASCVVLVPVLAAWFQQEQPPQEAATSLESRVAALEEVLAAERKRHDETRALLEQTLAYLDAQAKNAQTLLGVLDESQQLGFTAGINFQSREVLLGGLRAYWTEKPKGLPAVRPTTPAPAPRGAPATVPPKKTHG